MAASRKSGSSYSKRTIEPLLKAPFCHSPGSRSSHPSSAFLIRPSWLPFFAAILAPVGITLWYLVRPLNLYEKSTFTPQSLRNLPTRDAAACELAAILRSPNAGRFLFQRTQSFWLLFFVPMGAATFALHGNPVWAANPYWILRLPVFCLLLLAIYRIELLRWAIGVMKAGE